MLKLLLFISLSVLSTLTYAQVVTQQNILQGINPLNSDQLEYEKVIFDRVIYNDSVYSDSRKTELGDQSEINLAFRYHTDENTFARFRMATDPSENRFDNKTSRFEFIFSKQFKNLRFQIDMELLTDDTEDGSDSSGISLGLDLDSDDTLISYAYNKYLFTFYPFNFRSDVGDEFNTLDVTRIHSIDGSPTSINSTPVGDEKIVSKTIPGLEVMYQTGKSSAYIGVGIATYLYPTNGDFDIEDNQSADAWERKETSAIKAGYLYLDNNKTKVNLQYVSHQNTSETGALLKSAASLNTFKRFGDEIFEFEITMSQAGDAPYDVDRASNWFNNQTPFRPIFSDTNGEKQDWISETGFAYSLKIGKNIDNVTPYIGLKYQDEYFIFEGDESAHRLRNSTEELSHGGLTRIAVGAYFYYDNVYFNPQIEHQRAENPVFTNATDLRDDRELSSFEKTNTLLTFSVVYTFDGSSSNQTWWF
tara:strand:+ start:62466 stop:63890 length:1425 start_codon:yes stop_codon:yes gene_type:complete